MEVKAACKTALETGTVTTTSWVEAVRLDTRSCGIQGKAIAIITNGTGGTSIYWKIDGYPSDYDGTRGGKAVAIKAETELASLTSVTSTDVDKGYAAVVISIRGAGVLATATPANYQIDFNTY